jgi:hypothetical protein
LLQLRRRALDVCFRKRRIGEDAMHISIKQLLNNGVYLVVIMLPAGLHGATPESQRTWQEVVAARAEEAKAMNSVLCHFEFYLSADIGKAPHVNLAEKVEYGETAGKFYESIDTTQLGTNDQKHIEHAYDGIFLRSRNSAAPNFMSIGAKPDNFKLDPRTPAQQAEQYDPAIIDNFLQQGKIKLIDVVADKVGDANCRKCSFDLIDPTETQRMVVWYSVDSGFWPLLARRYGPEGELVDETHGITLAKTVQSGKEIFYPITGMDDIYQNGKSVWHTEFKVDPASLEINNDIPLEKFQLKPKPGEVVYDETSKTTRIEPAAATTSNSNSIPSQSAAPSSAQSQDEGISWRSRVLLAIGGLLVALIVGLFMAGRRRRKGVL